MKVYFLYDKIPNGKYESETVYDVFRFDPTYIQYMLIEWDDFYLDISRLPMSTPYVYVVETIDVVEHLPYLAIHIKENQVTRAKEYIAAYGNILRQEKFAFSDEAIMSWTRKNQLLKDNTLADSWLYKLEHLDYDFLGLYVSENTLSFELIRDIFEVFHVPFSLITDDGDYNEHSTEMAFTTTTTMQDIYSIAIVMKRCGIKTICPYNSVGCKIIIGSAEEKIDQGILYSLPGSIHYIPIDINDFLEINILLDTQDVVENYFIQKSIS